jgi:hypothetical protein
MVKWGKMLGVRFELARHAFAYAFAIHLLFGSVAVLDSLRLTFFFYFPRIIQITLIESNVDLLVWVGSVVLLSVLVVLSCTNRKRGADLFGLAMAILSMTTSFVLLLSQKTNFLPQMLVYAVFGLATIMVIALLLTRHSVIGHSAGTALSTSLIYLFAIFVALETSAAVHYALQSFNPSTQIGLVDAGLELQFSYAAYDLVSWLYAAFLFSWAWIPLVGRLLHYRAIKEWDDKTKMGIGPSAPARDGHWLSTLLDPRFVLALAAAIFVGFYPYFQNPPWLVGTDANWRYYYPLLRMSAQGISGGFVQALGEWHPAALAVMYGIQLAFRSTAFDIVKFTPLFLVVALGLSSWWFLAGKKNVTFDLLAFILSVLSITTTVGFYSSILANWMALLVWVLFFAYAAFRGDEGFRIIDLIVLLALSTLILFIHAWTWGVFATSVLLAAIVALLQEGRKGVRGTATLVSVIVIDLVAVLLVLTIIGGGTGSNVDDALQLYGYVIRNPSTLTFFWDALTRLTQIWAPFFNPLILAVSIVGVFYLSRSELTSWRRRLIFAWLFVSCIGSILVAPVGFDPANPTGSESQLWRLLFLTPFWLTAPVGVVGLRASINRLFGDQTQNAIGGQLQVAWIPVVLGVGVLLAWVPVFWHPFLMFMLLPGAVGLFMVKIRAQERQLLGDIVMVLLILVAFNNVTRCLSQLLLSPHNM